MAGLAILTTRDYVPFFAWPCEGSEWTAELEQVALEQGQRVADDIAYPPILVGAPA